MAVRELSNGDVDGTRLGQDSSDLVAFWGGTPVAQKSGANQATVALTATTVDPAGVTTLTLATAVNLLYTDVAAMRVLLNEIRNNMVSYNFIAGA